MCLNFSNLNVVDMLAILMRNVNNNCNTQKIQNYSLLCSIYLYYAYK